MTDLDIAFMAIVLTIAIGSQLYFYTCVYPQHRNRKCTKSHRNP